MAEIETRSRIPKWQTFWRIQWHVIPEPSAILQGAATWRIQRHDSRATCHITGCCHRANSLSRFQSNMPHCRVLPSDEFNNMSSQSHVSRCRVGLLPLAEFTVMIPEPRATLQGVRIPSAILKIVFHYILFFLFS